MAIQGIEHLADVTEIPLPAAGPGSELMAILTSCNERLHELQLQATDLVFAEAAAIQNAWLRAVIAVAQMAPQEADRDNARQLVDVINDWFQAVTQAQTALIELLGKSAIQGRHGAGLSFVERRRTAIVINFPDRRRAA